MKHILVAMTALAMLSISSPVVVAVAATSALCNGTDTGYNRPGGYCEQIASTKSLVPTGGSFDPCKKNPDLPECEV